MGTFVNHCSSSVPAKVLYACACVCVRHVILTIVGSQTLDSPPFSFLQRIRGLAFMRYINPRLID